MENFFSRLDSYMKFKGLNDNQITVQAGISNGLIGKGRKRGSLSQDNISKILYTYSDLDANWLLTGKGNMLKTEINAVQLHNSNLKIIDEVISNQDIPLYDLQAATGLKEFLDRYKSNKILNTIRIPNLPSCDGAISVIGDSMYPSLKSSDIIFFKKVPNNLESIYFGEMYLIGIISDFDQYITIKYIQKSEKGEEYIKLVSQNQHYQPKDVHLSKITALAIIKASIHFNTIF